MAPNTVAAYRHQLAKFIKHTPNKLACKLRPVDVTRWARSWHEVQAVLRVLQWSVHEAGLLKRHPLAKLRKPARGQRRRILTPQELATFLRRSRAAGRAFLIAMRETMARPQEVRAATVEQLASDTPGLQLDVALATGHALIVQGEWKDCRRRRDISRPRVLLVSKRLGRLILRILHARGWAGGPLFLNARGEPWTKNAVRCMMRRLRRALGVGADERGEQVTAYTLRHSLATWAAAAGVVDRTLADLLCHVETRTTSRYTHLNVRHLRDALARFAREHRKARSDANRDA